ncbi:MAG: aminotransferase class V-fold PLP-dependent enzyme, partial [Eggerthellaceae bacterium]|nr:aminotransferase class V-fold PLP-dependent enzyme [Eggerthellaceae bacterium]
MSAMPESYVYLDWAATAPLCEEAAAAMEPYLRPGPLNMVAGANANSLHSPGRAAFAALEEARRAFARTIGARANEVYFTSGATEADNAALCGMAHAAAARKRGSKAVAPQVVVSSIE